SGKVPAQAAPALPLQRLHVDRALPSGRGAGGHHPEVVDARRSPARADPGKRLGTDGDHAAPPRPGQPGRALDRPQGQARQPGRDRRSPLQQRSAHHHRVGQSRAAVMPSGEERYREERARIEQGHVKYRDKLRAEGKLFVRDRLKLLLDADSEFEEDWLFARNAEPETPADGVVTGVGTVGGRPICIMAHDYTAKAGSWGGTTIPDNARI